MGKVSRDVWNVISHVIPAFHIRGFVRGIRNEQTGHLRLAVKQYLPKNRIAQIGDITLIAAQGVDRFQGDAAYPEHRALVFMKRREFWPTREEARRLLSANPFLKAFDSEFFNLSIQYDLRDCPTAEYPKKVTLMRRPNPYNLPR